MSLNNFAISLNAIEKKYEAIDFRREALQITKELYIKNPSQSVEYYLASVNNFAISLNEIGKINEAIDFSKRSFKDN